MDYHFNKIESDRRQCEQERHAKKQKQIRFKQTLEDQIDGNTLDRRDTAIYERLPISTSFGPEEGHNENTALWKKKLEQQQVMKEMLEGQIEDLNQHKSHQR